ncbi:hypothetical protein KAR91_33935 [Candidatus Pacearchaeota archaeon]|nr:hypothetical protein [Candidatus Pacearchaeota archaeon]
MTYNFLHDESELQKFHLEIMPELKEFEVFFLSLSCRKKYLTAEEREKYHITRAEMFDRKLIRTNEYSRLLRSVHKYETEEGGYMTKNNLPVPQHCMTIYLNINPSNSLKALKEFNGKIVDWQYEITSGNKEYFTKKFNKMDIELMNCYQRNRGTKHWIDIDFDVPKDFNAPELLSKEIKESGVNFFWISTKSGYHLLLDRNTLSYDPNRICKRGLSELSSYLVDLKDIDKSYEIIINKNEMIPLPGTLQGGYPVRVLWEYRQ